MFPLINLVVRTQSILDILIARTVLFAVFFTALWASTTVDAVAQDKPPAHQITPTVAETARDVHTVDLDGDEAPDVLSASQSDNKIAWYENQLEEGGGFSSPKVISTNANQAQSVFAADLDSDGDSDVLSASKSDNKIAWYENRLGEGGGFSNPKMISTNAGQAQSVFAADLDGDGDSDVLSVSRSDNKVAWYENRLDEGKGFSDQKIISTNADGAHDVYATDLNGDGAPDVLSASRSDDKIAWYENMLGQGKGFSSQRVITTDADEAQSVFAADLDGDGSSDVLSASWRDDKIAWYENQLDEGKGFSDQKVISTNADGAQDVHATDLDGDGAPDVLFASSSFNDKVAWHKNQLGEEEGFSDEKIISTNVDSPQDVHAANLDGDGDPDVLSASLTDDKIAWYENDAASFSDQKVIVPFGRVPGAESVFAVDLNGDSNTDVLSASFDDDKIAWYKNQPGGNGEFSAQKVINEPDSNGQFTFPDGNADGAEDVHAADLDGDGDPDVLSASLRDDKIAWYENQLGQEGGFSDQRVISTNMNQAQSVFTADLDDDGDPDVLSASSSLSENKVAWYENQLGEGGGFSDQKVISTNAEGAFDVHAADLDGDGDSDVLSASQLDDKIAWYENQLEEGEGFSAQKVLTTNADATKSVHTADLDGDSDPDVVLTSGGEITWLQNQLSENGSFSDQNVISSNANLPRSVYAEDVNGDSAPDVLSASGDKIAWYENQLEEGEGFSDQKVISTDADMATSVFATDLNGDDSPDVLSASDGGNSNRGKVTWYENTSTTLPVELVSLEAAIMSKKSSRGVGGPSQIDGRAVRLTWQTASETRNSGFEVQRKTVSEKEAEWKRIGFVESTVSNGTTNQPQIYGFTDEDLPYKAERLQYRLRQMDLDGSESESDPVSVELTVGKLELRKTFPNPAHERATIRFAVPEGRDTSLHLYDVLGRQVRTIVQGEAQGRKELQVDLSNLSSGTYYLRLSTTNGQTKTQRLTILR